MVYYESMNKFYNLLNRFLLYQILFYLLSNRFLLYTYSILFYLILPAFLSFYASTSHQKFKIIYKNFFFDVHAPDRLYSDIFSNISNISIYHRSFQYTLVYFRILQNILIYFRTLQNILVYFRTLQYIVRILQNIFQANL